MNYQLFLFLFLASTVFSQQLSFPTAEGSGRFSTGGRGGEVYIVTNLNNSGPGSIVDAVSKGNRVIIFRVSGTIDLGGVILSPKSNTTIAGQTAPGEGICIKGRIYINASNVIIRYLRVRVDAGAANSSGDAIDIAGGSNIIIDHVSASYARDEGISCQETSDKVTVQWCIISEALTFENHSYGSLIRGDRGDTKSYHHNLYVHNNNRLPRPGNYTNYPTDTLGLFFDFRNNVVYNWKGTTPGYNADTGSVSRYNFIGNVYIPGPESNISGKIFKEDAYRAYGYFENNMYNGQILSDQWSLISWGSKFTTIRISEYKSRSYIIPMEPVTTTPPEQAYNDVLAHAGCSFPVRDTIDRRLVLDVINKTGRSISTVNEQPEGGWPPLNSSTPPQDSDSDGMPDDWELAHNLNPNDPSDRNMYSSAGYTMIEEYINGLVGESTLTSVQSLTTLQPTEVLLYQNFPNPFNPETIIEFQLKKAETVTLTVYNVFGQQVQILAKGLFSAGKHRFVFNGDRFASGMYFYRLNTPSQVITRKMVLTK